MGVLGSETQRYSGVQVQKWGCKEVHGDRGRGVQMYRGTEIQGT